MKIGDLVTWRSIFENQVGIILGIQPADERDFRSDDSIFVMWPNGTEWIWRKELEMINENR